MRSTKTALEKKSEEYLNARLGLGLNQTSQPPRQVADRKRLHAR